MEELKLSPKTAWLSTGLALGCSWGRRWFCKGWTPSARPKGTAWSLALEKTPYKVKITRELFVFAHPHWATGRRMHEDVTLSGNN